MKTVFICITLFSIIETQAYSQNENKKVTEDSLLRYHFSILSKCVKDHPKDTTYYCALGSAHYFEFLSNIPSTGAGTFAGRDFFTKTTYQRWQKWYVERLKRQVEKYVPKE